MRFPGYDASYQFRLLLEPAAVRQRSFAPDAGDLGRLIRMHRRLLDGDIPAPSYALLYDVDAAFHEILAGWSGNGFVRQAIEHQNRLRRLTEYEFYADRERMWQAKREHLDVLYAVANDDQERASRALYHHIVTSWYLRPDFGVPPPAGPDSDGQYLGGDPAFIQHQ